MVSRSPASSVSSPNSTAVQGAVSANADASTLWLDAQAILKQSLSQPSFEAWIAPLKALSSSDTDLTLEAENSFQRNWILKHYKTFVDEALKEVSGRSLTLIIKIAATPNTEPVLTHDEPRPIPREGQARASQPRTWTPRTTRSNLNPKYTFDLFVVGQHNRFCHAAAMAVAEAPGTAYNPLFLYGGVGLGKTHLVQSIGHYALIHHPDKTVKYVTAEQFTNDLINAIAKKEMQPFRDRYRKIDILIIDDIQFLEGKERTQEEVFHTFNTLHESGKQIILTSDRQPKLLSRLEDRLRSRFESGLIADMGSPDLETRVAILQKRVEKDPQLQALPWSNDIFTFVAQRHPANIRELEGAFNKVAAYAMLTRVPLELPLVRQLLGELNDPARLSPDTLLDTVAQYYHMSAADLKGPARAKDVAHARQVAIYLLRTLTEASYPKIGQWLGNRKHTTILYAFEKVREAKAINGLLNKQIEELTQRIQQQG